MRFHNRHPPSLRAGGWSPTARTQQGCAPSGGSGAGPFLPSPSFRPVAASPRLYLYHLMVHVREMDTSTSPQIRG